MKLIIVRSMETFHQHIHRWQLFPSGSNLSCKLTITNVKCCNLVSEWQSPPGGDYNKLGIHMIRLQYLFIKTRHKWYSPKLQVADLEFKYLSKWFSKSDFFNLIRWSTTWLNVFDIMHLWPPSSVRRTPLWNFLFVLEGTQMQNIASVFKLDLGSNRFTIFETK